MLIRKQIKCIQKYSKKNKFKRKKLLRKNEGKENKANSQEAVREIYSK